MSQVVEAEPRSNGKKVKQPKPKFNEEKRILGLSEEYAKLFDEKIRSINGAKVAVLAHRFPDPDAIGSMMGVVWLLKKTYGIDADMIYSGEVAHPQNKAMCSLLEPQLLKADDLPVETLNKYSLVILLDTIPANAGIGHLSPKFDIVIDHHKDLPPSDFEGLVLHRKTGSASSIVYDLIKILCPESFDIKVDTDTKIATALLTGIVTDTENLMSDDTTELEFQAYTELFPVRDSDALKQIVFFKRPQFWIQAKAQACSRAEIGDDGVALVGLGLIPDTQRDLIADMAEEMITWTSVETAIAFAVVGGTKIEASVRSSNPSLIVSDFCRKLGGEYGNGGGKKGKGAYRIPLSGASIDPDEDESDKHDAWEVINRREIKRIRRIIEK